VGADAVHRSQVEDEDVVIAMMDRFVQFGLDLHIAQAIQAALEDGVLEPFAVAFHDAEDLAPAFVVGDVVADDVEVFHAYLVTKLG